MPKIAKYHSKRVVFVTYLGGDNGIRTHDLLTASSVKSKNNGKLPLKRRKCRIFLLKSLVLRLNVVKNVVKKQAPLMGGGMMKGGLFKPLTVIYNGELDKVGSFVYNNPYKVVIFWSVCVR